MEKYGTIEPWLVLLLALFLNANLKKKRLWNNLRLVYLSKQVFFFHDLDELNCARPERNAFAVGKEYLNAMHKLNDNSMPIIFTHTIQPQRKEHCKPIVAYPHFRNARLTNYQPSGKKGREGSLIPLVRRILVGFVVILLAFVLDFQPFGTNLESMHVWYRCLSTHRVIVWNKTWWNKSTH